MKALILVFSLLLAWSAQAATTVASVVPVLHAINISLLEGSGITARYLPPARLPLNRVAGWLNKVDVATLPAADALLTMESLQPELALYPLLRQKNIRMVPIDVAQELAPGGARVSRQPGAEGEYFWLDAGNLTLMSNVAARDLARVWPEQAPRIEQNRQQLLRAIQGTAIKLDSLVLDNGIESVATTDARLLPLAQGLALPVVEPKEADLVLGSGKGGKEGARYWQPDALLRVNDQGLTAWLDLQLATLTKVLSQA